MSNLDVGLVGGQILYSDPGKMRVGNLGLSVMYTDNQPLRVGLVGVQILMDEVKGPPIKPASGSLLNVQIL